MNEGRRDFKEEHSMNSEQDLFERWEAIGMKEDKTRGGGENSVVETFSKPGRDLLTYLVEEGKPSVVLCRLFPGVPGDS